MGGKLTGLVQQAQHVTRETLAHRLKRRAREIVDRHTVFCGEHLVVPIARNKKHVAHAKLALQRTGMRISRVACEVWPLSVHVAAGCPFVIFCVLVSGSDTRKRHTARRDQIVVLHARCEAHRRHSTRELCGGVMSGECRDCGGHHTERTRGLAREVGAVLRASDRAKRASCCSHRHYAIPSPLLQRPSTGSCEHPRFVRQTRNNDIRITHKKYLGCAFVRVLFCMTKCKNRPNIGRFSESLLPYSGVFCGT